MRAAISFTTLLEEPGESEFEGAARFNLALCKQLLGQSAEAAAEFERYREQNAADGRLVEVAYQLGVLHDEAGRFDAAIGEYGKALSLKPDASLATELRFRRGACHERLGDRDAALADYRKSLASKNAEDPFRISAAARCAAIYEETEDYKNALSVYRELVEHSNDPELVAVASERVAQLESIVR
jgi:tetratricopeptide (TPR) repeat protein